MENTVPNSPPNSPDPRSNKPLIIALISSVVALAAIGLAVYVVTIKNPTTAYLSGNAVDFVKRTGLSTPVVNSLDWSFKDSDGDLLADPPSDSSKLIDPDPLLISYVAAEDPEKYRDAFKELCDHIAQATGKKVKYELFPNSDEELKAMHDGKLHIAGFSTGSVPVAVDLCGFIPFATLGSGTSGGYKMEIIVPADSAMNTVDDLRGHELALTELNSNSGYKAPLVLLSKDYGMLPGRDFGVRYTGGQDSSIEGIASKKYDAAAVANNVLARAVSNGQIKKTDFRVIFASDTFPNAAIGYAYNLKQNLAARIKTAIFEFDWKGSGLEKEFGPSGETNFIPIDFKKDWAIVRQIDDAIGSKYAIR